MIGSVLELPTDHPGVSDPEYVDRRNHLAHLSASARVGRPPTDGRLHAASSTMCGRRCIRRSLRCTPNYAVAEYRTAAAAARSADRRVPQLADVSDRLTELTGWRLCAVPGLVSTAEFFGALADRCFPSSQYVRHASVPFYTPEPDIIHELIGHANSLASPRIAGLYERAGQVAGASHRSDAGRSARQGVLVHARVRCRDGTTVCCAPTAPAC